SGTSTRNGAGQPIKTDHPAASARNAARQNTAPDHWPHRRRPAIWQAPPAGPDENKDCRTPPSASGGPAATALASLMAESKPHGRLPSSIQ
ncbi:hypothetical protein COF51_31045, partial [Bacillus pseudomycoides]